MRRLIVPIVVLALAVATAPAASAKLYFTGLDRAMLRWGDPVSTTISGCPGDQDCGIHVGGTAVYLAPGEPVPAGPGDRRPPGMVRLGAVAASGTLAFRLGRPKPGRYHLEARESGVPGWLPASAAFDVLPSVAPGGRCPVSAPHAVGTEGGPVLGAGPAYAVLGGSTLGYIPARNFDSELWGGRKLAWLSRPGTPRLVVRGRRLDGPEIVRFEDGDVPADHLVVSAAPRRGDWRHDPFFQPSYARLSAPGCYAFVVDTQRGGVAYRDRLQVHEVIVFRAVAAPR